MSTYSTPAWAIAGRNDPQATQYNPNAPTPGGVRRLHEGGRDALQRHLRARRAPPRRCRGVRHFEIWNEPNLKSFFRFNGSEHLAKYKGLVKAAYTEHQGRQHEGRS